MAEEKAKEEKNNEKIDGTIGEKKIEAGEKEKKMEEKPREVEKKIEKEKAVVNGKNLGVSKKQAMAVCRFIKGKSIGQSIKELEDITKMKKALPMKGEIPHRKGMMSGRYPIKTCMAFIRLLKSLEANCNINSIEEPQIYQAKANDASRPYRRFGSRRFKRSHIYIEARSRAVKEENKKMEDNRKEKK